MILSDYAQVFTNRKLAVIMLLGIASGLPLALTGGTLQAWMTVEGVDLKTIGFFTLVGMPYTWKFLWAPLLDRFQLTKLGQRRSWLIATQLGLIALIAAMAMTSPKEQAQTMALLAVLVALMSATQDIAADAYRTDVLNDKDRGLGGALYVVGYRVAMLISGAVALAWATGGSVFGLSLGEGIGWKNVYFVMAGAMSIGLIAALWGDEPPKRVANQSLEGLMSTAFKEFFSRQSAITLLVLIVLYKLGDAFAGSLTTSFLIRGVGFSPAEVGVVNKGMGLVATIGGVLFGGTLMVKLGLYRALLVFGVAQALSNLMFMWLAYAGHDNTIMVSAICVENITGGMGTAAFVALLMALTDRRFTATQYALLSAFSAVGRVYVGPVAGYLVDPLSFGMAWGPFFFLTFLTALPGLFLLVMLKETVQALSGPTDPAPATD